MTSALIRAIMDTSVNGFDVRSLELINAIRGRGQYCMRM